MRRYMKVFALLCKSAAMKELEHRADFIANTLMSTFWLIWGILSISIFYGHTDSIGGWGYYQALIISSMFGLIYGFIETIMQPNARRIAEDIQKGALDFVLVKPIDSMFLVSFRDFLIWRIVDVALALIVIGFALARIDWRFEIAAVAIALFMVVNALVIVYSIWLILATLAFWTVQSNNFTDIFRAVYEAARYPVSVFPAWLRIGLSFIVPLAFMTTFPVSMALGELPYRYGAYSLAISATLLIAARVFWRFALRRYASASS